KSTGPRSISMIPTTPPPMLEPTTVVCRPPPSRATRTELGWTLPRFPSDQRSARPARSASAIASGRRPSSGFMPRSPATRARSVPCPRPVLAKLPWSVISAFSGAASRMARASRPIRHAPAVWLLLGPIITGPIMSRTLLACLRPPSARLGAGGASWRCPSVGWRPTSGEARAPEENDEREAVGDEKGRNPEGWNPVGRAHVAIGPVHGREDDGVEQVQRALDVEHPHQESRDAAPGQHGRQRNEREDRRQEISIGGGDRELGRQPRVNRTGAEEHQAEVPEGVEEQDGRHHPPEPQLSQAWHDVDPRRDREDPGAEEQIDGEDVHAPLPSPRSARGLF